MDANYLRVSGIVASSVALAVALAIAAPWRSVERADREQIAIQTAQSSAVAGRETPSPVRLVVRFRGNGPIARAQRIAARGRETQAGETVRKALARQTAFQGLCFANFTRGGAEMVLRPCSDVSPTERVTFQTRWLARLNAMRAVDYADVDPAIAREPE